jgi:hypothetical protein
LREHFGAASFVFDIGLDIEAHRRTTLIDLNPWGRPRTPAYLTGWPMTSIGRLGSWSTKLVSRSRTAPTRSVENPPGRARNGEGLEARSFLCLQRARQ